MVGLFAFQGVGGAGGLGGEGGVVGAGVVSVNWELDGRAQPNGRLNYVEDVYGTRLKCGRRHPGPEVLHHQTQENNSGERVRRPCRRRSRT